MIPRIILAGGSGFLGQTLASYFQDRGFEIVVLTRSPGRTHVTGRQVAWDAQRLGSWQKEMEGATAVVNLTGKSVNCRYNERNRRAILSSRVNSTRVIGEAIACSENGPTVWLNASTATIYQHTFCEPWDENGVIAPTPEAKDGFSVEVATAWEEAFDRVPTLHTRKVAMRMAMVLGSGANSVFPVLHRLVRFGLGGKMGNGRQFVSWIHEDDFCRAVEWLLVHDEIAGPVNLASPHPLANSEMMRTLRQTCSVPFGLLATNWMLEMGAFILRTETELVIKSRRVVPGRLIESGFKFQFPTIAQAFKNLCRSTFSPEGF